MISFVHVCSLLFSPWIARLFIEKATNFLYLGPSVAAYKPIYPNLSWKYRTHPRLTPIFPPSLLEIRLDFLAAQESDGHCLGAYVTQGLLSLSTGLSISILSQSHSVVVIPYLFLLIPLISPFCFPFHPRILTLLALPWCLLPSASAPLIRSRARSMVLESKYANIMIQLPNFNCPFWHHQPSTCVLKN